MRFFSFENGRRRDISEQEYERLRSGEREPDLIDAILMDCGEPKIVSIPLDVKEPCM